MRAIALIGAYAFAIPGLLLLLVACVVLFPAWVLWGWAADPVWAA